MQRSISSPARAAFQRSCRGSRKAADGRANERARRPRRRGIALARRRAHGVGRRRARARASRRERSAAEARDDGSAAPRPFLVHHRTPAPPLAPPAPVAHDLTFEHESEKGVVGAFIAAPAAMDVPLTFSDGTRIVLFPTTRARVSEIGPKGARVLVESGKLHADVVHTGDAEW